MADSWYVAQGNQKYGPYTMAQLKDFAAHGQLLPTQMLHQEGMVKWVPACTVEGLFPLQPRVAGMNVPSPQATVGNTPAREENLVNWVRGQYSKNPQRVLLAVCMTLALVICLCAGGVAVLEKEILAALIGAVATIGAAVLGLMSVGWQIRANQATAELPPSLANGKRTLTSEDLKFLDVPPPMLPTSTSVASPVATSGEAEARLIFPGSDRFSGSDRDWWSSIHVYLDGQSIGPGSGRSGFSLTLKTSVGRHTLVFTWTYSREKYDGSSRDHEERRETVFWLVRSGKCVIHLKDTDRGIEVDHSEPPSAFPNCYACSFPTNQKCKCGRNRCQDHTADWLGRKVCAVCHAEAFQKTYKWTAIALGVLAAIAGIVWLASRRSARGQFTEVLCPASITEVIAAHRPRE